MPRRKRVGFVLERASPTRIVARIPAKTREEGGGYAPTITYFCASSKFSRLARQISSHNIGWMVRDFFAPGFSGHQGAFSHASDVFNASPRLLKGHNAINRKFGFASVLLDAS